MKTDKKIETEVLNIIKKISKNRKVNLNSKLIGSSSFIDSMTLVQLCISLEDYSNKLNFNFDWTSEKALSKSQSIFKKGSGILITLFVSNISWLTFVAACYYGFKNFSFYQVLLGIGFSVILVQLVFARLSLYINSKFDNKSKLIKIKTTIEYLIIILIAYYIFF